MGNITYAKMERHFCIKCGHIDNISPIPAFNTVCSKCGGVSLKLADNIDTEPEMLRVVRDYLKEFDVLIATYFDGFASIDIGGFNIPVLNMNTFVDADFVAKSPEIIYDILEIMEDFKIDYDKINVGVITANGLYAIIMTPNMDKLINNAQDNSQKAKCTKDDLHEKCVYLENIRSIVYPYVLGGLEGLAASRAAAATDK